MIIFLGTTFAGKTPSALGEPRITALRGKIAQGQNKKSAFIQVIKSALRLTGGSEISLYESLKEKES